MSDPWAPCFHIYGFLFTSLMCLGVGSVVLLFGYRWSLECGRWASLFIPNSSLMELALSSSHLSCFKKQTTHHEIFGFGLARCGPPASRWDCLRSRGVTPVGRGEVCLLSVQQAANVRNRVRVIVQPNWHNLTAIQNSSLAPPFFNPNSEPWMYLHHMRLHWLCNMDLMYKPNALATHLLQF